MAPVKGDDGKSTGFTPSSPFGVWGDSGEGTGIIGSSSTLGVQGVSFEKQTPAHLPLGAGVRGEGLVGVAGYTSEANARPGSVYIGVLGCAANDDDPEKLPFGRGVLGLGAGIGVEGRSLKGPGVAGHSSTGSGVAGEANQGSGVYGYSFAGSGVSGSSRNKNGIEGFSQGLCGVYGECSARYGSGILGLATGSGGVGVVGFGGRRAALFYGAIDVVGAITKSGGGFVIDHPLEPESRYLSHSFVESQERKNIYDGVVVCDRNGEAVVHLPSWFEPLNKDLRYQLTPLGRPSPDLHVAAEFADGVFKIAGGAPGLRVNWQVTGVRRDAWAEANPLEIEEDKASGDRGYFLHPELHGSTMARCIHRAYLKQPNKDEEPSLCSLDHGSGQQPSPHD